jgi:hypothetical protein
MESIYEVAAFLANSLVIVSAALGALRRYIKVRRRR